MSVQRADDPYKSIVALLAASAWRGVAMPSSDGTSVGSTRIDTGKPAMDAAAEQSLDAAAGPSGEQGDALDLSMDGTYRRKKSGEAVTSMLYSAPEDPKSAPTALGAASGSASSASLAQSLKAVGDKKDASWGGEKAQRGFTAAKLAGGSLSGLGGSSGASSASGGSSMGAFGSGAAQVGYASTRPARRGVPVGEVRQHVA